MAVVTFKNGSDYLEKLNNLDRNLRKKVIGAAVYDGANIVANQIREQLEELPTDERFGTSQSKTRGPNKHQKEGLIRSLGIAPIKDDDGFINVKIGFSGYNGIKTKRWPRGQPNQMVARSVENGTSWMEKNQPVKKAVNKTRKMVIESMGKTVDSETEKMMKGK